LNTDEEGNDGTDSSAAIPTLLKSETKGFIENAKRKEGSKMQPKIVERPGFTVVGLKYRGKNENNEIPQLWQAFGPRVGEIKNMVDDHVAYGISANIDKSSGEFDYIAGFEVSTVEEIPRDMVSFEVPGGKYAVFSTTLPRIGETFDSAYHTWLPQSGYQPIGGPEFEVYDEHFDPQEPDSLFDLYIPVM
jgi:AraC family transcriptional regulator